MAMSGIEISEDVIPTYREMKIGKKFGCIMLKLSKNLKEVVVDKKIDVDEWSDLEKLKENLPTNDACYVLYDFKYTTTKSGQPNTKIIFISWIPEEAPIKVKMVYAATKETLKSKLEGLGALIEATDLDDVNMEDIMFKLNR